VWEFLLHVRFVPGMRSCSGSGSQPAVGNWCGHRHRRDRRCVCPLIGMHDTKPVPNMLALRHGLRPMGKAMTVGTTGTVGLAMDRCGRFWGPYRTAKVVPRTQGRETKVVGMGAVGFRFSGMSLVVKKQLLNHIKHINENGVRYGQHVVLRLTMSSFAYLRTSVCTKGLSIWRQAYSGLSGPRTPEFIGRRRWMCPQ
jgi:hypothetical protein